MAQSSKSVKDAPRSRSQSLVDAMRKRTSSVASALNFLSRSHASVSMTIDDTNLLIYTSMMLFTLTHLNSTFFLIHI